VRKRGGRNVKWGKNSSPGAAQQHGEVTKKKGIVRKAAEVSFSLGTKNMVEHRRADGGWTESGKGKKDEGGAVTF